MDADDPRTVDIVSSLDGDVLLLTIMPPPPGASLMFSRPWLAQRLSEADAEAAAAGIVRQVFVLDWLDPDGLLLAMLKEILRSRGSLAMICPNETVRDVMRIVFDRTPDVAIHASLDRFRRRSGALPP